MNQTKRILEILIATMNRNDLSFLDKMFPSGYNHLYLVIINQTSKDNLLTSDSKNITILNCFAKGLSRSRNRAIAHAQAAICLFSDDDVIFLPEFERHIHLAFLNSPKAVITFKTASPHNKPFWKYPSQTGEHTDLTKILPHEIAINREMIIANDIFFDEHFGLGATFEDSENYIFLKEVSQKIEQPYFYNETIAIHPEFTSSDDIASDRHIFARAALNYKFNKNKVYLWLAKLMAFLVKTKRISIKEIPTKWQKGIAGIKKYKELKREEHN